MAPKICKKTLKCRNLMIFGQFVSKNGFFKNFPNSRCLGPFSRCFPAVFPLFGLFSRGFPAVFPLFSRCFLAVLRLFNFCKVLRSKRTKNQKFQKFGPEQWFCGQNAQKKTEFSEIWPRTEVLRPKRTKQQNFQKFCPKQVKTDKTTKISEILPRAGRKGQKEPNFKNLAQNGSKRTKKHIFQNLCAEQWVLQSKRTKKIKFQKSCPEQWFAVKACKTNRDFRINAPNCRKQRFCFRIAISVGFWAKIKFLHVFY